MNKPIGKTTSMIFWVIIILATIILGYLVYKYIRENDIQPTSTTIIQHSPAVSPKTSPSTSPTATSSSPSDKMTIKIFMVAEGDNGASGKLFGCGDSIMAVEREIPKTQAVLKAALEQLLSIKDKSYGGSGLYNALYQSDLKLASVAINNEKATIKLTGTLKTEGECDEIRPKVQIEETAFQFSTVKEVEILVNDKNINEVLSPEGRS